MFKFTTTKSNTQHTHSRKQSNHSFSRTHRPDTLIWEHCCKLTAILSAERSTSGATSRDHGETTTVRPSVRSTVPVEPAGGGTADSCSAYHDQTAEVANRYWLHIQWRAQNAELRVFLLYIFNDWTCQYSVQWPLSSWFEDYNSLTNVLISSVSTPTMVCYSSKEIISQKPLSRY